MKIETSNGLISSSSTEVYNFLLDMNNFLELLPQEKIEEWKATSETCTFKVKDMSDIGLKRVASKSDTLIYLDSFGKVPFKFTLNIFLSQIDENQTNVNMVFEGNINPFMKMMLEKPLTTFLNGLIVKLKEKYIK